MPTLTTPAAQIEIVPENEGYRLRLSTASGDVFDPPAHLSADRLNIARSLAMESLGELKQIILGSEPSDEFGFVRDWTTVARSFSKLLDLSWRLLSDLLEPNPDAPVQFAYRLRSALERCELGGRVPFVELICSTDTIIPIDLLLATEEQLTTPITDAASLAAAARMLLGFRAVTRISFRGQPIAPPRAREVVDCVRAAFFRHAGLAQVGREHRELGAIDGLSVAEPSPSETGTSTTVQAELLAALGRPPHPRELEVLHIACHCSVLPRAARRSSSSSTASRTAR